MRIDQLAVAVRPRQLWEAADMGPVMLRQWWRSVYPPWLVACLLTFALLGVVFYDSPGLVLFFFWWFKPLLGRIPLYVLSRKMFGTRVSAIAALKAFPGLAFKLPFFLRITVFRISAMRGVILPVWMLEGSKGKERRRRESLIRNQLSTSAVGVTLMFMVFEWIVLWMGLYVFCLMVTPVGMHEHFPDFDVLGESWIGAVLYLMTVVFLEPFYVAVCFALYLNCRTILEGWDLELTFRNLANRLKEQAARLQVTQGLILCIMLLPALGTLGQAQDIVPPEDAAAATASQVSEDNDRTRARALVEEIKGKPPYDNGSEKRTTWRWRFQKDEVEEPREMTATPSLGFLASFMKFFIYLICGVALLVFLTFLIRAFLERNNSDGAGTTLVEVDMREGPNMSKIIEAETLPDNILQGAKEAFAKGETRKAMSYLFRGALLHLAETGKLELANFATEGECVRQVKRHMKKPFATFFAELVSVWQRVAYGHQSLDASTFEKVCSDWQQHVEFTP